MLPRNEKHISTEISLCTDMTIVKHPLLADSLRSFYL
eukprot:COSAG02_NODE_42078_length_388_cov_0.716263_1_plen_36_part_10